MKVLMLMVLVSIIIYLTCSILSCSFHIREWRDDYKTPLILIWGFLEILLSVILLI